jgi:hypothetical protein
MSGKLLQLLEHLIEKKWTHKTGAEDLVSAIADCSGFVHLCLVYLGYNVPRRSSNDWYDLSADHRTVPSVVSVPGHVGLLVSRDLVLEVVKLRGSANALRSVSLQDWILSVESLGSPKYLSLASQKLGSS